MANLVDTLLEAPNSEFSLIFAYEEWINPLLLKGEVKPWLLIKYLESHQLPSQFGKGYSSSQVDSIKRLIIEMLNSDQSIPLLINKLRSYHGGNHAATMLGWFGSRARNALPALLGCIGSSDPITGAAKTAVIIIGGAEDLILKILEQSIVDEDDATFIEETDLALSTSLGSNQEFLAILMRGANSNNPHIREVVADAINRLNQTDKIEMLQTLETLIHDPHDFVSKAARETLTSIQSDNLKE